ncbi:MAG TPA: GNAT family N-acetyltransferase [Candidatus Onthousia faecavium]|nr:GNAT family N-acetyltransferase [Candidatus Onthousia faecavium]
MTNIYLKVPSIEDLKYRKIWMMDSKTMSYNAGFDINLKGYDKNTGTIFKNDEEMKEWFDNWINKEPDKFFAYIYSYDELQPVGEIYYYLTGDIHEMGILIQDKFRGKRYSYAALMELEKVAFEKNNVNELSDMIPLDRIGAIKVFKKAGFIHTDKEKIEKVFDNDVIVKQFLITKDMYFKAKNY